MAPIVPGISSHPAKLELTIQLTARHGATFVRASLLYLEGGTLTYFLDYLRRGYPNLVEGYNRLYASKHASPRYANRVMSVLGTLKMRYGIVNRRPEQSH